MKMENGKNSVLIFGGAFDPPHLGHEEVLNDLVTRLRPKKIWVTPSFQPNLKVTQTLFEHRLDMATFLVNRIKTKNPNLDISVQPIERELRISYTFDLLLHLQKNNISPTFVMGSDQFAQWPRWHRFPEVVSLAHWIIWKRKLQVTSPEHQSDIAAIEKLGMKEGWLNPSRIQWIVTDAREVSSQEIRAAYAKANHDFLQQNLDPNVLHYIERNKLYGIT